MVALTAVLQAGDRLATLVWRHCNASLPPGVTPEHFDMKSDRQAPRMALCCSGVTWAAAAVAKVATANAVNRAVRRLFEIIEAPTCECHILREDDLLSHLENFGCNCRGGVSDAAGRRIVAAKEFADGDGCQ
jgi:hypothetical protein